MTRRRRCASHHISTNGPPTGWRGLFGQVRQVARSDLIQHADPRGGQIAVADFGEVAVVATEDAGIDRPSELDRKYLAAAQGRQTMLFALHSVSGWGAFAWWDGDGDLIRSVSASHDVGYSENFGSPRDFEAAARDEHADLGFDPMDLVECALAARLGFCYEGVPPPNALDAADIPVLVYQA